jgi:hypothetical protein
MPTATLQFPELRPTCTFDQMIDLHWSPFLAQCVVWWQHQGHCLNWHWNEENNVYHPSDWFGCLYHKSKKNWGHTVSLEQNNMIRYNCFIYLILSICSSRIIFFRRRHDLWDFEIVSQNRWFNQHDFRVIRSKSHWSRDQSQWRTFQLNRLVTRQPAFSTRFDRILPVKSNSLRRRTLSTSGRNEEKRFANYHRLEILYGRTALDNKIAQVRSLA